MSGNMEMKAAPRRIFVGQGQDSGRVRKTEEKGWGTPYGTLVRRLEQEQGDIGTVEPILGYVAKGMKLSLSWFTGNRRKSPSEMRSSKKVTVISNKSIPQEAAEETGPLALLRCRELGKRI